MHSDIIIRQCTPEDAAEAVPLIVSSGPDAFRYIFSVKSPDDVTSFVTYAFLDGEGELGYKNHIVLTQAGTVIAVGALWSSKEMLNFTLQGMKQILRAYGVWQGVKVIRRALQLESVVQPPQKAIAYLGHFGVVAESRGRGIGTQLIHGLMDMGQERGFCTYGLDVSVENPRAQELYERLGFRVKSTSQGGEGNGFGRIHDHHYMECLVE